MQKGNPKKKVFREQTQRKPGLEYKMDPLPEFDVKSKGSNKLIDKVCVISGGDSGIGRAVAVAFAREGADVAIIFLPNEERDAEFTADYINKTYKRNCILLPVDLMKESNCQNAISKVSKKYKNIDVLVNNAAVHYPEKEFSDITTEHLIETFTVNVFSMFWLTKAALKKMNSGSSIINTTSVTAYRGSGGLIDYSSTKGAIVSFTRSLSANLVGRGVRVNGVAPGPVWTPLVPSSFDGKKVSEYGTDTPMKRPGQPVEVAHAYVFLASDDASYITGQIIHVNGGEIING
jgi:NAD(P)-dependent dehydrogenase (short-subunit alcohol dehydrogenase family)